MCKKVIIIGSGLGGLSTGVILSRNGFDVTVIEQGSQYGGCLQSFSRNGVKFETGMHFIGSARKGQTLNRMFEFLGISDDIKLSELDRSGYDVISIGKKTYRFPNGKDEFISQMSEYFPSQRENLINYYNLVKKISDSSSLHSFRDISSSLAMNTEYHSTSINKVIDDLISDPLLAKVLVGNLPLYAGEKDKTPFSTHAFIADFYNQSAFRIVGGSGNIASALVRNIQNNGGKVLVKHKATKIVCDNQKAIGVEVNGKEFMPADIIISSMHPARTLDLLDTKLIRPAYRNRIKSIPQTVGGFSIYLEFEKDSLPYMNYNFYGYNNAENTPWNCEKYDDNSWPKGYIYMHFCQEEHPKFATTGTIISYMNFKDLEKWKGTEINHRGAEYEQFKHDKAEKLIDAVEKDFPGFRKHIKRYYTSTPLTYYDYTGTEGGSMYGNAKDINMGAACRVQQRTRIPNLYLTGQNINSHGILGVIIGSIVTCGELIPAETIFKQIIGTEHEQ